VAGQILRVYETVAGAGAKVEVAGTAGNTAGAFRAKARGSK
jgi:phosphatidylinositol alpha-mannosyltransferase